VTPLPIETQAQRLADYLPGGRLFQAKNMPASNLRNLLRGLAGEMHTADGHVCEYQEDSNPSVTIYFLEEWEKALGIPDHCFPGNGTVDQRRLHVLVKLAALGVQTGQDFIDLAALFGITVSIASGHDFAVFPLVFPIFLVTELEARFTIFVTFTVQGVDIFPITFPYTFGDDTVAILECLFRRLKPANCDVVFTQV
jgi:uncharacterized protein YmfQ (DUF2313 family)